MLTIDEVTRSMQVDPSSKTPYSDATQVGFCLFFNIMDSLVEKLAKFFFNKLTRRFCSYLENIFFSGRFT